MTLPGTLVIARHHESEWNKEGLWTGHHDSHLTELGFKKSHEMGLLIKDVHVDYAYASMQVRAIETLSSMLEALHLEHIPTEHAHALDERDYGDYTGKNKREVEKMIGKEEFDKIRREWDYPVPHGETLKMVYERVVPFYKAVVLPLVAAGRNVLVVSHGNALRALEVYIESIPTEKAHNVEMLFGAAVLYRVDEEGKMTGKEVRSVEPEAGA